MDVAKLNNAQFAALFTKVVEKIKEDPINNFFKARGFMDFKPTAAQTVALKTIFGKPLDYLEKHIIRSETKDSKGLFQLEDMELSIIHVFHLRNL